MTDLGPPHYWSKLVKQCCLCVSLCLLLGCSDAAIDTSIFERFEGTWGASLDGSKAGCNGNWHQIRFNDQRSKAYFQFKEAWVGDDGTEEQQVVYTIARYDHRSIVMSIDGETRTDADGNSVVWELVPIDGSSYTWHRMDWEEGHYTQPFVRCGNSIISTSKSEPRS